MCTHCAQNMIDVSDQVLVTLDQTEDVQANGSDVGVSISYFI